MALGAETTTDEVLAGVDLAGKIAVVTGATAGIGQETARALAAHGAQVVITARNKEKAEEALATLRKEVPNGKFESAIMDLGSLKSVRACAKDIVARHPKIDLLINNAGVMATPFGRTEDGFEMQFGVDHLGHFVFGNMLVPALLAAAPSRIVCLSSAAHLRSDVLWDDINFERTAYDKFMAYGQAKTANVLYAVALERRLAARGVHAYAIHPGAIGTQLGRYMTRDDIEAMMKWSGRLSTSAPKGASASIVRKTIPQGAASSVWAATAPELAQKGGVYIQDCQIAEPDAPGKPGVKPYALDPAAAEKLWGISEIMVGQTFTLD